MKTYEDECKKLSEKCMKKREKIISKYKDAPYVGGLDTSPDSKELGEVTKWFSKEVKKLRAKYGME